MTQYLKNRTSALNYSRKNNMHKVKKDFVKYEIYTKLEMSSEALGELKDELDEVVKRKVKDCSETTIYSNWAYART